MSSKPQQILHQYGDLPSGFRQAEAGGSAVWLDDSDPVRLGVRIADAIWAAVNGPRGELRERQDGTTTKA